ncbi:MAG TPA: hypothetical protein VGJ90_00210 [Methylophilaceae bacterium]|jgi:hypothetical protein
MAKDNFNQSRQLIAQTAARMIVEDGIADFAYAKKKAGRQLGVLENSSLPTNSEVEEEIRLYHELYSEDQPEMLRQLRQDALMAMELLARFNPHLTGSVLNGTAGKHAETHIHLFADSAKEVEIFLLNNKIDYDTNEKSFRTSNDMKRDRKSNDRLRVPVFTLEGPNGMIKLSVFEYDDIRVATKSSTSGGNAERLDVAGVQALLKQA